MKIEAQARAVAFSVPSYKSLPAVNKKLITAFLDPKPNIRAISILKTPSFIKGESSVNEKRQLTSGLIFIYHPPEGCGSGGSG
jgi:hypothetical protein